MLGVALAGVRNLGAVRASVGRELCCQRAVIMRSRWLC